MHGAPVTIDTSDTRERPTAAIARQRLPAALVHYWLRDPLTWETSLAPRAEIGALLRAPGVQHVREGLLAVVPSRGSAEIFDAAARAARVLLRAAGGKARLLIVPGQREETADGVWRWHDALGEALTQRPPALSWNAVYLSGYAAHRLEGRFRQMPRGVYQAPSGHVVPLIRLGGNRPWDDPRRNAQSLGRAVKAVPRTLASAALEQRLDEPILRVEGILGAGKSRLVWDALVQRGEEYAWSVCAGEAAGGSHALAEQLFAELLARSGSAGRGADKGSHLTRRDLLEDPLFLALRLVDACGAVRQGGQPFRLVIDAIENASANDLALVEVLCGMPQVGDSIRLILIGRCGAQWPAETAGAPPVRVPLLGLTEADALGTQLIRGLSGPDEVLRRFSEGAGGNPLALEEGLHALIHRGGLKRIYGSFFFSGDAGTTFEPSERWICQVQAEAGRLGEVAPLLALAAAGCALPAATAGAAAPRAAAERWEDPFIAAGWLQDAETPWGPGYETTCAALLSALRSTLPETELAALRQAAGRDLAGRRALGAAGWQAYQLLRGTPEAQPALLGAAREAAELDAIEGGLDELLGALRSESERGEPAARLDLLWELLPLAHQHGRLEAYARELEIAVGLAADQPKRLLALGALRAELQESQGRFADAETSLRQALEAAIAREGHADRKALLSIRLGRVLVRDERFAEARRLFEDIQPLLDRAERTTLAASCDFYLGNIALHEDRLDEARAYHEVALRTRREKGQRAAAGASLSALGATALAQGFYTEALEHFETARRTLGDAGDPSFELLGAGRALDRMGDFAAASSLLRQALALRTGKADATAEAVVRLALAENQLNLDHGDVARRELLQAHFLLSMHSPSRALGDVECLLGRLALRQKQIAEARAHFKTALEIHRARMDHSAAIMDLAWGLEAARLQDDAPGGAELFAEAHAALDRSPYPERGEIADLALFRGAGWLSGRGVVDPPDPLSFLQRGYENLVRKMARLSPENRNRYLLQVAANREILQAATQHGVAASA